MTRGEVLALRLAKQAGIDSATARIVMVQDQPVAMSANFVDDARQLWRRFVFNHLITNVDDHLQNIGFLCCGNNPWRLSPAFDLNPFPDKDRESKTWLSEDSGPITSLEQLWGQAPRFALSQVEAQAVLDEMVAAVKRWREVAIEPDVGLQSHEIKDFRPAFEGLDIQ